MHKQTVKTGQVLTPAQEKLLEFFESKEIPDLIKCLERVFETACFFSMKEHQDFDITALYFQYELIGLLKEIEPEQ